MLRFKSGIAALCAAALLLTSGCGTAAPASVASAAPVDAGSPVSITVWNYYNGDQLDAFNSMVDEFNETVGKEKGIEVSSYSQGGVSELETNVLAAAEGKVGADPMPNIFSGYADTTYALDQMGMVVDLSDYLTEEERSAYIDGYLEEGDFSGTGSIKIFPTAKSTELLFLNKTDWEPFAEATGATYDDLQTIEGLWKLRKNTTNGPTASPPKRATARHSLAVMPWQTTCSLAHVSWAVPFLMCRMEK